MKHADAMLGASFHWSSSCATLGASSSGESGTIGSAPHGQQDFCCEPEKNSSNVHRFLYLLALNLANSLCYNGFPITGGSTTGAVVQGATVKAHAIANKPRSDCTKQGRRFFQHRRPPYWHLCSDVQQGWISNCKLSANQRAGR